MGELQTIPETFLGVGYTRDRAGLPLEGAADAYAKMMAGKARFRIVLTMG